MLFAVFLIIAITNYRRKKLFCIDFSVDYCTCILCFTEMAGGLVFEYRADWTQARKWVETELADSSNRELDNHNNRNRPIQEQGVQYIPQSTHTLHKKDRDPTRRAARRSTQVSADASYSIKTFAVGSNVRWPKRQRRVTLPSFLCGLSVEVNQHVETLFYRNSAKRDVLQY